MRSPLPHRSGKQKKGRRGDCPGVFYLILTFFLCFFSFAALLKVEWSEVILAHPCTKAELYVVSYFYM
jgi:hypothetical protein